MKRLRPKRAGVLVLLLLSMAAAAGPTQSTTPSTGRVRQPLNNGQRFTLICRGGPGLRVSSSPVLVGGVIAPGIRFDWLIAFSRSTQPPDPSGRNLEPGQCSPADFPLRNTDPAEFQTQVNDNGSLPGTPLYPWEKSDRDANVDSSQRLTKLIAYLQDPQNYWSFVVMDDGSGHVNAASSAYWKPEFYRGPEVSPVDSTRINQDNSYVLTPPPGRGVRPRPSAAVTPIDTSAAMTPVDHSGTGQVLDTAYTELQPANTIQVQVRYKKEYGYKFDSDAFAGSGPSSCGAFSVSARPAPSVRQDHLYGIHNPGKMPESNGSYVCDFLITDLPLNAPIAVAVDLADYRSLPFETWKGGSQAQPPVGQQRTIIIGGGRGSRVTRGDTEMLAAPSPPQDTTRTVTLTERQPRARLVFEMVYAVAAGNATPSKAIGRAIAPSTTAPARPICDVAREARARNSPAAPGLEAQCRAAGGPQPPAAASAQTADALAAKGEAIANADPLALTLRNRESEGAGQRGFDIGMAAAEGDTLPGPGKQRIHDALTPAEQRGFETAVAFSLERNRNADAAARGAAIAKVDPLVAAARTVERDVFYSLGFDIATGIFGDPALGAQGNTATGPGSLSIRDSLSAAGQRGFNASVTLHLSRKYKR